MALDALLVVAGLVVLARGSDTFVVGAARLSTAWGVSPVLVGAVVVGFGTGVPELFVSGLAAAEGSLDLAVGNLIGSNLANLTLVLGVGGLLARPEVVPRVLRREAPVSFAAVALFALLLQGGLGVGEGLVLLVSLAGAVVLLLRVTEQEERAVDETPADAAAEEDLVEEVEELLEADDTDDGPGRAGAGAPAPDRRGRARVARDLGRAVVGLVATVLGAQLLVVGAQAIAGDLGLSDGFVGLTLVAIGTSLPELVTAIQSARRDETSLLVGNVLGSNVFNSLAVAGTCALLAPGPLHDRGVTLLAAGSMVLVAGLAWLFLGRGGVLQRWEAAVLLGVYAVTLPLSG
ncbi:MAG: calcium/sodium antiporter [Acidimicrobiales bacterium]|nr:calcium/sodium antiporter [Acidimicrobiales bacterium]